ncbi:MAG: hypothetical protein IJZ51_07150 [Ruminiclostridium sp.]|nr:hypothetical protein [Ruminiclostridium sp.]
MKSFKIFSGRYILRMLIILPLVWCLCYGTGFVIGTVAGNMEPDTESSVTEEIETEEEDEGFIEGFMNGAFAMMGGITVIATTGIIANFMFRIDGSKYVRTIRNSHKHYAKAYGITAVASLFSAVIGCFALCLISNVILGLPLFTEQLMSIVLCTVISSALANIIISFMFFVKSTTVRGIFIVVTMMSTMIISRIISENVALNFIVVITAVALVLFIAALIVATKRIQRRWLFD